jgi:SAM-dependent methyltransferase
MDAERFRHFEKTAHDRLADSYHAFFVPITDHAAEPLLDAASVRSGTRVLDVATGSGVVAGHAAARKAAVTGADLSPRMVSLAARLNPTCTFKEADVESLPFADNAFDAVVCAFGIGHFPDPEASVAECARVLAAGGHLALSWWDLPVRNRLQGTLIEAIQEVGAVPPRDLPTGPPLLRYSEGESMRALLAGAALNDVVVTLHHFTYDIVDADTLWNGAMGSMARTSSLLAAQTSEMRERVRSEFDRRLAPYFASGHIALPVGFIVASARKGGP